MGQGSFGPAAGLGASLEVAMRAFSAKVWERSSTGCSFSASLAGTEGWEDAAAGAKGFAAGLLVVEKGFPPDNAKGFAFWLLWDGFTPKSDSPMLACLGLGSSAGGDACSDGAS